MTIKTRSQLKTDRDITLASGSPNTALEVRSEMDHISDSALFAEDGAVIKTSYEGQADTNALTNAMKTKLNFITVTQAVDLDAIETAAFAQPTLDQLTDVVITTPADNNVLAFDSASGNFIDQTAGEAGLAAASHAHAAADVTSGTFADARIAAGNVTQHVAAINHNALLNYVAAEHIDWSQDQGATDINTGNVPIFAAGAPGIVPQSGGGTANFLRADGTWVTPAGGGSLNNIVEDTTPQLGGNLDVNGQSIVSITNGNIALVPNGTGAVAVTGNLRLGELADHNSTVAAGFGYLWVKNDTPNSLMFTDDAATDHKFLFDTSGTTLAAKTTLQSADDILIFDSAAGDAPKIAPATEFRQETIIIAVSDETTALAAGTAKRTFRMPFAMTLVSVRASVITAPTGSTLIVDINEAGATVLSTKLSIDATEKTSQTAAAPPVISDAALADDAEMTIDIDQVGSTIAGVGLKVILKGYRT